MSCQSSPEISKMLGFNHLSAIVSGPISWLSESEIHSVESCDQVDCCKMKLIFCTLAYMDCTSAYMEIENRKHVENSPKSHFHQLLPILQIRKTLNCNNSAHGQNFAKKFRSS